MNTCMDISLRWFTQADAEDCAYIDGDWTKEEILAAKTPDNTVCVIAQAVENDKLVLGYALYKLENKNIAILRLAVEKTVRRQCIATALLSKVMYAAKKYNKIYCDVPERYLDLQLFLKKQKFKCTAINRKTGTYRFEFAISK